MSDITSFVRLKIAGWLSWQIVRWLPIPFFKPRTLYWYALAWLWGWAYTADAFHTLAEWRQFRTKQED